MDLSTISPESSNTLKKLAWMSVLLNNRKLSVPLPYSKLLEQMQSYLTKIDTEFSIAYLKNDVDLGPLTKDILEIPVMRDVLDVNTYNIKRTVYYEKVKATSNEVCDKSDNENITRDVGLIIALANADLYREESYILLPTVLIIVNMKQKYAKLG